MEITRKTEPVSATDDLRNSLDEAAELYVFEGLPHPLFEEDLFQSETTRDDTTLIGGFPFYTPEFLVDANSSAGLKKALTNPKNYAEFVAEKLCGGFHPDYAISWLDGSEKVSILLCFNCEEVLFVHANGSHRYDFGHLEKPLSQFKRKRPSGV